jgi:hypothetical protein
VLQQRPATHSLVSYAKSLPLSDSATGYDLCQLVDDLLEYAKENMSSNAIAIPVLQTFGVLLDAEALTRLSAIDRGCARCAHVTFLMALPPDFYRVFGDCFQFRLEILII